MSTEGIIALVIIGLILTAVGIWELVISIKYFRNVKSGAVKSKSGFLGFSIWFSLVFGVLFSGAGLGTLINAIINVTKL
ncbi:hypothetical protein [Lapidilactobacillus luobeiensis]|uniref:hypothetical protein n=1 Tax=Lapidilactobacillus luobeiensis TaxID=2950371 RepID=UPI0021C2A584|nr:hypothetical protein [Lapidilactobacillus luobeiensis]